MKSEMKIIVNIEKFRKVDEVNANVISNLPNKFFFFFLENFLYCASKQPVFNKNYENL